jgi:hypothetical protein
MPIQDRPRTRTRGRMTLVTFALAASACTLEIPEGWLPEIPTSPDTDTGADDAGEEHTPTTGGEAPEPDTDTTCGGDPDAGSSSESTGPDTGDATRGSTSGESTGTDTGSETTGDVLTGDTTDSESTGTGTSGDVTTGSGSSSTGGMCGDAVVDAGELCDDGVNDGAYGGCEMCLARAPFCGDGKVNGPEAVRQRAREASSDCTTTCSPADLRGRHRAGGRAVRGLRGRHQGLPGARVRRRRARLRCDDLQVRSEQLHRLRQRGASRRTRPATGPTSGGSTARRSGSPPER